MNSYCSVWIMGLFAHILPYVGFVLSTVWATKINKAEFLTSASIQSSQVEEALEAGPQKEVGKDSTAG